MQPPPRKGKVTAALRNIHNEQLLKLQTKHQQDSDFLEDIRNFTKLRATIEKEYATALLKLATTYLQKKCPIISEGKCEGGECHKNVYAVWKTMLDETEKIAKARLAATEVYQQQVSESAKSVKLYKLQVAKKCFDNFRKMHEEIQQCVVEIDKCKKLYFEEEHMAHEARDKAHDADEKLKRKKGRIFQSISSLQKNSAKFSFRREACDIQATKARNDYVLALVAANAHQSKYYNKDVPDLIQILDCDIYEKVKEYILLISRTELLTCAACQSSFSIVQEQANMASSQHTADCYLKDNAVLSKPVLYEFEPCDNDQITKLSTDHNAGLCLSKEARRWATCLAKETRVIRDSVEELKKLLAQLGDKPLYSTGEQQGPQAEIEARIDELRQTVRRAETSKQKAEARLEAMKDSGVNIDEWMRTSDSDSVSASESPAEVLSRSGTVVSRTSQRSVQSEPLDDCQETGKFIVFLVNVCKLNFDTTSEANDVSYDSDNVDGTPDTVIAADTQVASTVEDQSVSDFANAVDIVAAVQNAWDAAAVTEEEEEVVESPPIQETVAEPPIVNGEPPVPVICQRCVAMFSYQATNSDELSFVEQEELELIGEGDGDGWVKARNYRGEEGYIPQNYVEIIESQPPESSARPPLRSFSSVDYSMPEEDAGIVIEPVADDIEKKAVPDSLPVSSVVNGDVNVEVQAPQEIFCQAVYDYEATCDEELTFFEGQVIKIIRKSVHDVDDGWWEGELDGKIGLFPSLVVEELKENGEPRTPVGGMTPDSAPPPAYTPPKPQFLIPPTQVTLTQPTPEVENAQGTSEQKTVAIVMEDPNFHIELPDKQQAQYQTQFSASDSESSEHEAPVAEDVGKYAPLESSPDSPTRALANSLKKDAEKEISDDKPKSEVPTQECPIVVITKPQVEDSAEAESESEPEEKSVAVDQVPEHSDDPSADKFECTFAEDTPVATQADGVTPSVARPVDSSAQSTSPEVQSTSVSKSCHTDNSAQDIPTTAVDSSDIPADIEMTSVGESVAESNNSCPTYQDTQSDTTG